MSLDAATTVTLSFVVGDGVLTVSGESATGQVDGRRQRALPGDHRRRRRPALARRPSTESPVSGSRSAPAAPIPEQAPDATTQAQRGLEPASSGPGGAGTDNVPASGASANPGVREIAERPTATVDRCCSGGGSCCSSSPSSRECVVLGAIAVVVIRDRDQAQARERELSVSLERVAQLATAYADQETGERGYALTGEPAFLAPYTEGSQRAPRRSRPSSARTLDELRDRRGARPRSSPPVQTWRREAAEVEIALRDTSGWRGRGGGRGRQPATGNGAVRAGARTPRGARRIGAAEASRCRGEPRPASASGSPGCSSASHSSPIVGAILAGVAHPPLGHASDRRARRRGASRSRRFARLADPDRRATRALVARARRRRHARPHPPAAGRFRALTRGGRAERGGGAHAAIGARARRRADPRRAGRSPRPCARPRVSSPATATTCSSPSRATSRSSSSTSPVTARPRASWRSAARRCCAPRSRPAPQPGDALRHHRRAARRHG